MSNIILALWYIQFNSKRLVNLIFIFLFINGSLNSLLKFIFKWPLDLSLNNQCWYSFPSGHMQYGLVFWGIIVINAKYNLKLSVALTLLLIASGIVMAGKKFHTPIEMIAAIPPAATILYIYSKTLSRINLVKNNLLLLNIASITIQLITLAIVESPCENYKLGWMWLNVGANIGFIAQSIVAQDKVENILFEIRKKLKLPLSYIFLLLIIAELRAFYILIGSYKAEAANLLCGISIQVMLFLTSKLYQKLNTING
jgi:hypothetical protein